MKGTSTRLIAFATSVCLSTPLLTVNISASAADTLYSAEITADIPFYISPSTKWDFDSYTLTSEKRDNIPYLTGNASVESGEVKFPSNSTASGELELDFSKPIKSDTVIEFDITPHSKHLGTQYTSYSIQNSEEEEILGFQIHPYDTSVEVKGISVCGNTIADGKSVCKNLPAGSSAHIKNDIDYSAGKITVTVGDGVFTADIPASAATDIAGFNFSVKRSKNAADRYISLDNLSVSEYTSENPPAKADEAVTDGYIESVFNAIPCRINAPADYSDTSYPLVVYLHSESRTGTNNFSQLYNSQYIFNKLKGNAVLIAPQAEESFTADSMSQFIAEAAEEYNTSLITVIGQSESGSVCYELAANGTADKIAVLSCGAELTSETAEAIKNNGTSIWSFGGYNDSKISLSSVRSAAALLQSSGVDVTYTEYPYSGHNITENVAEEIGFSDWCISNEQTEKIVDLVLFSGQSNMAGRGTYSDATVCPPGQGYEFHSVTSPSILTTIQEPFGKYENNSTINDSGSNGVDRRSGDMVSSVIKAYFAKTGVPMVGVQASRGGTNTKWWKQSAQYTEAANRYNSAYKYLTDAGYTVRRKLLVWCQGEADADSGVSADTYKSNTLSIFDTLKNATGITDVFIVQTGHYNVYANGNTPSDSAYTLDSRYFNINRAQKELAENNENIHTVASFYTDYGLSNMRDAYHFYQPVYNSVGETAGINIAAAYDSSIDKVEFPQSKSPVTPPPTESPSESPTEAPTTIPTEEPTASPTNSLSWDFSTDQTAASGNNVPIISGTASYDSENKNIKFDANNKNSGELKVSLSPAANGVVTIDFDAHITSLGQQYLNYNVYDSDNNTVVSFKFDAYNSKGILSICGETVAENGDIKVNTKTTDGMGVTPTHFKTEIHYPKGTVTVTIAKSDSSYVTFNGKIPQNYKKDVSALSISKTSSKTANRSMYIDNLSISSYMPNTEMYVTGAARIAKRMGTNVTEQYTLSKTYTDNNETVRWTAEGVEGVTIDENTGLLTVNEDAAVGKVTITATLIKGGTLPTGTKAQTTVEICPFAALSEYRLGGSSTIEIGKTSKISLASVTDTDNNDITEFAELSDFASNAGDIASVSENGTITAHKSGVTDITFNIKINKLGTTVPITYTVKTGIYEITSADTDIDVSKLISYGTKLYRLYKPDGSYESVTSADGVVKNTTGGAVTVVPQYQFEFTGTAAPTDSLISGYVKATSEYSPEKGYGLLSDLNYNINENGCSPIDGRPVKVNLPCGNYDISVYRKGGTRADVYNDDIQIINNTTSYGSDNRPSGYGIMDAPQMLIADGTADITFGHTSGSNERIASVSFARVPDKLKKQIIWIAGDSESANYYPINADGDDLQSNKIMMTGFGMQLGKFLNSKKYSIADFGQPSATVKTWYDECFESVNYRMSKGDIIIICFGINEAVSNSNKLSADEMKAYMSRIISAAKAKGVTPILVSPVYNNKYQSKSLFTYSTATNSNDMYSFADEVGVSCIDINKGTQLYISDAVAETGNSSWAKLNYHVNDNLHLSQHSAVMVAAMIAGGMKKLGYSTTDFAHTYRDIADVITESESGYTSRGTETGTQRVYSIKSLEKYVALNSADVTEKYPVTVTYSNGKLTLTSSDKSIGGGTLVKTGYKNDVLTKLSLSDITFNNGYAEENVQLSDGDTIYLWNSLTDMKPLSKKFVYEAEEETPAPTEKPTEAPTEEPDVILYSQDFENFSNGDTALWSSPAGTMAVKTDSTPGINKYQTVVSGKSGTCRSGYIEIPAVTDNFVFECDYKASSNANVNDLELLESKNSVYANHGVYSNANFAFTMARPKNTDVYVINNKFDDSGASLSRYTEPVFTTNEINDNPWLHVKVVGNFDTQVVFVYITSLDGSVSYYKGVHDMNTGRDKKINSWKCIHLLSPSSGSDTCIDNIKVRKAKASDLSPKYHKVTAFCKADSFDQYVFDGKTIAKLPNVSSYGKYFDGWRCGGKLYSDSEMKEHPITADCTIEGVINESYIEALETVEFNSFPGGNMLSMGEDENTYGDNEISLKITGEQGTSLVTNPDSRVSDFKIDWSFDGFRTLDGRPTGETGNVYCDSYALCEINGAAQSTVNFKLKKTTANYYGLVTAKVTYNGKEITVSKPLLLLSDTSQDNNAIYPAAGYTADYGKYESTLDGYRITDSDILTGGWNTAGSDSTYGHLASDSTGRYLSLSRAASGNSSYVYQTIGNITSQTVFEQDIRFNLNGSIAYGNGKNGSVTTNYSSAFELSFDGSNLKINGNTLCAAATGIWYHIEINADPTSKKCFARVYALNKDGNYRSAVPLAKSDIIDFTSNYSSGLTYRIALGKTADKTLDINNLKIYTAGADTVSFNAVYPQTVAIPETGTETAELSINAETVSGEPYIGIAEWKIDDSLAEGVTINSTGNSTAQLIINSNASSGELPIRITLGGKSIVINIKLLGTKDNIVFTSAPKGIKIVAGEHSFTAEVRNGNAETVSGKTVTYELFDENGTNRISPNGLALNSKSGVLTVTDKAEPQKLCIKAVSTDADGNEISKLFKFTLYDLKFSFGTSNPKDGFTAVNSETIYSESLGFGLEGNVTDEENAVSGAGTVFKLNLEKGRAYNVTAVFNGTIRCERIDSSFPGFDKTRTTLGETEYKVAVFGDDIMDITIPSDGKLTSLSIEPIEYKTTAKSDWWTIGDSTVQQNGSWGYTIAANSTSDLSRYPELSAVIDTFHNSGKAGEQHKNFYSNGRLNSILTQMKPGDVVSLSGMGTNDSSSSQADFKRYDEIYMNAIIDMGGYVILGSYTPTGNYGTTAGKVYDSDTMTFKGMRTNPYDLAIRALYEENKSNEKVLGFLDIGKMADEKMTQDVKTVYTAVTADGADESAARSAANARAEEMMAWWKDYNHYYTVFSNYILPDITKAAAELIAEKK